jgi:hypothetical protein
MAEEMIFEDWWEENYWAIDDGSQQAEALRVYAESAWQASRENQQEYQKHEFCRDVDCENIYNQKSCVVPHDVHCSFTAKEFHHWLKDNGYKIVKVE